MARSAAPEGSGIPRAWDDRLLSVLDANRAGQDHARIAADLGVDAANVAAMIDRVRVADLAESGEPAAEVAGHYP